jgi:hypothetical protein
VLVLTVRTAPGQDGGIASAGGSGAGSMSATTTTAAGAGRSIEGTDGSKGSK